MNKDKASVKLSFAKVALLQNDDEDGNKKHQLHHHQQQYHNPHINTYNNSPSTTSPSSSHSSPSTAPSPATFDMDPISSIRISGGEHCTSSPPVPSTPNTNMIHDLASRCTEAPDYTTAYIFSEGTNNNTTVTTNNNCKETAQSNNLHFFMNNIVSGDHNNNASTNIRTQHLKSAPPSSSLTTSPTLSSSSRKSGSNSFQRGDICNNIVAPAVGAHDYNYYSTLSSPTTPLPVSGPHYHGQQHYQKKNNNDNNNRQYFFNSQSNSIQLGDTITTETIIRNIDDENSEFVTIDTGAIYLDDFTTANTTTTTTTTTSKSKMSTNASPYHHHFSTMVSHPPNSYSSYSLPSCSWVTPRWVDSTTPTPVFHSPPCIQHHNQHQNQLEHNQHVNWVATPSIYHTSTNPPTTTTTTTLWAYAPMANPPFFNPPPIPTHWVDYNVSPSHQQQSDPHPQDASLQLKEEPVPFFDSAIQSDQIIDQHNHHHYHQSPSPLSFTPSDKADDDSTGFNCSHFFEDVVEDENNNNNGDEFITHDIEVVLSSSTTPNDTPITTITSSSASSSATSMEPESWSPYSNPSMSSQLSIFGNTWDDNDHNHLLQNHRRQDVDDVVRF
eukprot:TRINITY_DN9527_c0_g1_i1.p1 TRINITY_DN9527_c0_g1~~TRINITY_DN9527_c0_g1_i1.p1  ORF type:complete len:609 (+),score=172.73 TRINITY_DN9527_c0_g1_i1:88-1914(+)